MAIDANKIIQAIMSGSRIREEKGIIPLFGVYLSLLSVQYYNKLSFNFERKMGGSKEAERLLVEAGQECGYAMIDAYNVITVDCFFNLGL